MRKPLRPFDLRRIRGLIAASTWVATLAIVNSAPAAQVARLESPNRAVRLTISIENDHLTLSADLKSQPVLEPADLAFSIDGHELAKGVAAKNVATYEVNESYPYRGVHSSATNNCRGAKIDLHQAATDTDFTLDARVYNDGIAFRFIAPGGDKSRVPDENTQFRLPAATTVWFHDLGGHYEGVHQKYELSEVKAGVWAAPPLTFKLSGDAGFGAITEAALANYPGMALEADGQGGFRVVLAHKHPTSHPFELRYAKDVDRMKEPASIAGTITTPWRVVLLAKDLNALVNSDIISNLCPPPDPSLFPNGIATSWLKPGRAVWRYLDGRGTDAYADAREYSRLAGQLGFEYNVLEGYWNRWSDQEIKELVDFSKQQGVGLWVWLNSRSMRDAERRRATFKRCHDLGIVGLKIDFFDHEAKEIIDLYQAILREAAENHLMVNFHGSNKPTGEPRTWPNEMVREAVKGMESRNVASRSVHDTTLPFTRFLAGHADVTPVLFTERRGDTTPAHQVASAVVFTAPLLTYGASPKTLLESPAVEMIKSIPSTWDETIALPDSEIGRCAAFARRKGDVWFLAILNGPQSRSIKVPLSFLTPSKYQVLTVKDAKDDSGAMQVENSTATRADEIAIELPAGGGYIARFKNSDAPQIAKSSPPRVFLLNAANLAATKQRLRDNHDEKLTAALEELKHAANEELKKGPYSVVNKPFTPKTGDKHDYMSQAPYFWPDPNKPDGLPYLRRDGERNPETQKYRNRPDLGNLMDAVDTLALAYYFTDDETYANKAAELLRAWFLDPATRMNPNLNFGQFVPGESTGRGRGLIETAGLTRMIDDLGLLENSQSLTADDRRGLRQWFDQFLTWMLDSDIGRDEAAAKNNHGTYYDLQVISFAFFVGKDDIAKRVLNEAGKKRIGQVAPDGRQPLELARTKAWGYSLMNLTGLMSLARMGEHAGIDLWNFETDDGRSIKKAIDYMLPYAAGEKQWDHPQLGGWSPRGFNAILRRASPHYPDERYREVLAKNADDSRGFNALLRQSTGRVVQPTPEEAATSQGKSDPPADGSAGQKAAP